MQLSKFTLFADNKLCVNKILTIIKIENDLNNLVSVIGMHLC